jgi:hypothetical protein
MHMHQIAYATGSATRPGYHHVSPDHLHRYVDEFAFRLNDDNVRRRTVARRDSMIDGAAGKRLTYKGLTQ